MGLFRIAFGLCLIANLIDHAAGGNLTTFFSNDGVLTNHYALFAPIQLRVWSLLFAFSRPGEVAVAFAAIFVVYLLYTVGWRTRLMQLLVLICFISILNRNLLLQDGGSFTCSVLAVWTTFLPLGARFSVDAWRRARRFEAAQAGSSSSSEALPARHVSFVCLALLIQLAVIYGFNAANKTGASWRGGTAVHYILWLNSRNTWLAGLLRMHEPTWFSPLLSRATLVFEWTAPVLALCPVRQVPLRRLLIVGMWCFHLGIASLMSLGPFAYAMMTFSILLLGPADWVLLERLGRRLRDAARRRSNALPPLLVGCSRRLRPAPQPSCPVLSRSVSPALASRLGRATRACRELAALFLFVLMATELSLANSVIPPALQLHGRPQWMGDILYYLRVYQTWAMFAPDVPRDDGVIVVDATLTDGSHIDPLTEAPPNFEAPLGGPSRYDHDWSEYTYYFPWDRHRPYRAGLRDYVLARAAGWPPSRRLRSFEVFWVSADLPPPGERTARNLRRESLIAYDSGP
ncbi:MAG TPA: HTTM domain-containing protein [Polyangia bacterium]